MPLPAAQVVRRIAGRAHRRVNSAVLGAGRWSSRRSFTGARARGSSAPRQSMPTAGRGGDGGNGGAGSSSSRGSRSRSSSSISEELPGTNGEATASRMEPDVEVCERHDTDHDIEMSDVARLDADPDARVRVGEEVSNPLREP